MLKNASLSRRQFMVRMAGAGMVPLLAVPPRPVVAEPLRIGIVGLGITGSEYAVLGAASGMAKICTICDIDPGALHRAAEPLRRLRMEPQFATRVEQLWDDSQIEAVVVATPREHRTGLAHQAIQAGKHVFVKPPWSSSSEESRRLADASRSHGVLAVQAPYSPHWDIAGLADALRPQIGGAVRRVFGQLSVEDTSQGPLLDSMEVARRLIGAEAPSKVTAFPSAGLAGDSLLMQFPSGAAAIQRIQKASNAFDTLHLRIEAELGDIEVTIQAVEDESFQDGRAGALDAFAALVRGERQTIPTPDSHLAYETMTLATQALRTGGTLHRA